MASAALLLLMAMAILCIARCFATDTISASSAISGRQTIVSRGGNFELGFFRPPGDSNTTSSAPSSQNYYYVGIWYRKIVSQCTPVWVANRAAPVRDAASSQFAVAADGNLVIINEAGKLVWSTNISAAASSADPVVAVISDIGNLVLQREDGEVLWQSMEHPTDTWLPGFRIGLNKLTGDVQTLTSWKNYGDPAPGAYSLGIDPDGSNQFFISWNGTVRFWGSGEWNGNIFAGIPEMTSHYIYDFQFVSDANASYFTYSLKDPAVISRLGMDVSGQIRQLTWVPGLEQWMLIWTEPHQLCDDVYAVCGAFGVCDENGEPFCSCLAGFRPVSEGDWDLGDRTLGCRRNTALRQCETGMNISAQDDDNAFLPIPGISLPRNPSVAQASSAEECRLICMRNCECNAYSYGSGCALWYGDLLNLERLADDTACGGGNNEFYVRMSAAMDAPPKGRKRDRIAMASSIAAMLALSVAVSLLVTTYKRRQSTMRFRQAASDGGVEVQRREEGDQELLGEDRRRQLRVGVQGNAARP